MRQFFLILCSTLLLLAACSPAPQNATSSMQNRENAPAQQQAGLANPASVYCQQLGGTSIPVETPEGIYSKCRLPSGEIIEEWVLYRRNHPATNGTTQ
ncbi:putative hemolysin [Desulfovibrio cuneatus]|uniref:putative hemolysin n=1 Tax=Desulfovibrio cuneatus TaxID=159728 RepID=UPI00048628A7|nr:DUF333 domain-containing protein [Desulfovibrio cuneatus]